MTDAPTGVRSVTYHVDTRDDPPYLAWTVEFDLGSNAETTHAMSEVAMNAAVGWLREQYPESAILASRSYTGDLDGQEWPEAPV